MYSRKDFEGLKHNPLALQKGQRMVDVYPVLARSHVFTEVPDLREKDKADNLVISEDELDLCVRFTVLLVEQRGNPMRFDTDFGAKADAAWTLLGVRDTRDIRKLQKSGHRWFHSMIFEYFKMSNDTLYQEWFALRMSFIELARLIAMPVSESSAVAEMIRAKKDAAATLKNLRQSISALESELFSSKDLTEIVLLESYFPDRLAEKYAQVYDESIYS